MTIDMDKREKLAQLLLDMAREQNAKRDGDTRPPSPLAVGDLHPKSAGMYRERARRILSLLAEGPMSASESEQAKSEESPHTAGILDMCKLHGSFHPCPWCAKGAPDFRDPPDLAAGPATVREPEQSPPRRKGKTDAG